MSDKEIKNEENVSEPVKKDEEISGADKILQQIKEKQKANLIEEEKEQEQEKEKEQEQVKEKEKEQVQVKEEEEEKEKEQVQVKEEEKEQEKKQEQADLTSSETSVTSTDNSEISSSEEIEDYKLTESKEPKFEEKDESVIEIIDYSQFSKNELLENFNDLLNQKDVIKHENNIKEIRKRFHTLRKPYRNLCRRRGIGRSAILAYENRSRKYRPLDRQFCLRIGGVLHDAVWPSALLSLIFQTH